MSHLSILAASTKATLLEVSRQAGALGIGLQNAAPAEKADAPNNSIQYLLSVAESLQQIAKNCEEIISSNV